MIAIMRLPDRKSDINGVVVRLSAVLQSFAQVPEQTKDPEEERARPTPDAQFPSVGTGTSLPRLAEAGVGRIHLPRHAQQLAALRS